MLYTENAVKANVRNREGRRVFYLKKGDTLTPGARDWIKAERIEIMDAQNARLPRFELIGGGFAEEKPEHMTHLNAEVLVSKTHPRIKFRGAMDALEAEIIHAQLETTEKTAKKLGEILELARKIIRCDVLEEELKETALCGMTEDEIRTRSHRPQEFYNQPHFMPEYTDGAAMAHLNKARCAARWAELCAVEAFLNRDGKPERTDIIKALNRMSSMLYILMIRTKCGDRNGKNEFRDADRAHLKTYFRRD